MPLVEQRRQRAQDAGLRLAAQPEKNEVVARQDGVDDLGTDGVVVADDAGKQRLAPSLPPPPPPFSKAVRESAQFVKPDSVS